MQKWEYLTATVTVEKPQEKSAREVPLPVSPVTK
jgi:hypothetical protein